MVVREMLGTASSMPVLCTAVVFAGDLGSAGLLTGTGFQTTSEHLWAGTHRSCLLARGVGGFSRGHALPFFLLRDRAGM